MANVRSAYTDSVGFFGREDPRELAARFGTPLYVYSENILRQRCRELLGLSSHPGFHVDYSAKANTNPALLRIIREEGCLVDAMSPGELRLNLLAGFRPEEIMYVCNNVSADELKNAVDHGLLVSVDSLSQLELYGRVNPGGRVMVRCNPGIGAGHSAKVVTAGKERVARSGGRSVAAGRAAGSHRFRRRLRHSLSQVRGGKTPRFGRVGAIVACTPDGVDGGAWLRGPFLH